MKYPLSDLYIRVDCIKEDALKDILKPQCQESFFKLPPGYVEVERIKINRKYSYRTCFAVFIAGFVILGLTSGLILSLFFLGKDLLIK